MIIPRIRNLIFVSPLPNLDRDFVDPSIPRNFVFRKGHQLPRVPLYTNVDDAISGRYLNETPEPLLYVYRAREIKNESLIKPSLTDCPYGLLIDEYWSLINVRPEFLGTIKIDPKKPIKEETFRYGPRQTETKIKRWKWKEVLKSWEKPKLKD